MATFIKLHSAKNGKEFRINADHIVFPKRAVEVLDNSDRELHCTFLCYDFDQAKRPGELSPPTLVQETPDEIDELVTNKKAEIIRKALKEGHRLT